MDSRWEDPDIVRQFAEREPDHRLVALVEGHPPAGMRVLDLGCAAGRNAIFLARLGADVHAVDLSTPMVELTRRRLSEVSGEEEAARRVHQRRMDDLSIFADGTFDLVIALGVLHQAETLEEWRRTVSECSRISGPGALLLLAHFAPGTDMTGEHGRLVSPEDHIHEIREDGFALLLTADELDAEMSAHGFETGAPTETVRVPIEGGGLRVTVNGLYHRRA